MPDFYQPGMDESEEDILPSLLAAAQAAQMLQQQGVRLIPSAPQRQGIPLRTLMGLRPRQAVRFLSQLPPGPTRAQETADQRNETAIINYILKRHGETRKISEDDKIRDRQGSEFARQFGDVLADTAETENHFKQAGLDLLKLNQAVSRLQQEGEITFDKENKVFKPVLPTQTPAASPRLGFLGGIGFSLGRKADFEKAKQEEASTFEGAKRQRINLAETLNKILHEREEEAVSASEAAKERLKTTDDFIKRIQNEGFEIDPKSGSLVHVVTGKRYPIQPPSKGKAATNGAPSTPGKLIPLGPGRFRYTQ